MTFHGSPDARLALAPPPPAETTTSGPTADAQTSTPVVGPTGTTQRAQVVGPAAVTSPSPSSTTRSLPVAPPTKPGISSCSPSDLKVTAGTDAASYGPGSPVTVVISVVNSGATDCPTDPDNCATEADIYDSGAHLVWRSAYNNASLCGSTGINTLKPGQSLSRSFTWYQQDCRQGAPGTQCTGATAAAGHYFAGGIFVGADSTIQARRSAFDLKGVGGR
jgi:hypothetical protein